MTEKNEQCFKCMMDNERKNYINCTKSTKYLPYTVAVI